MEPSILNVNKCSYEELAEVVQSTRIAAAILGLKARYGTVTAERLAEIPDLPPEVMPLLDCTPAGGEVGPSTSHTRTSENPQSTAPLPSENTPIHLHSGPSGQRTSAPSKDHPSYYPWDKYPPPMQKTGTGQPRATGPTDTQHHQGSENFPRGGSVGETPSVGGTQPHQGTANFPRGGSVGETPSVGGTQPHQGTANFPRGGSVGETPSVGGTQPHQGTAGFSQGGPCPPQVGVYPPQTGSYPPQVGAYPPQGDTYPPQTATYSPQVGAYPPQGGTYPTQRGMNPPQLGTYPPQGGAYPPQVGTYPHREVPTPHTQGQIPNRG